MSETSHEAPHHEGHPAPKKKGGKKVGGVSQKVLVAAAVLTVLLTYLLYRRSKASSSTTSTDATTANGLGGTPADYGGGGGGGSFGGGSSGDTSGTSSSGTSSSGTTASSSPIAVVSDKADEAIAEANGLLPSQIRYAGSDPNAGNANAVSLGYDAPTDLAVYNPSTDTGAFDLGLSGMLNNGLPALEGATRVQTQQELQQLLGLPVTMTQAAATGTTGVAAPASTPAVKVNTATPVIAAHPAVVSKPTLAVQSKPVATVAKTPATAKKS